MKLSISITIVFLKISPLLFSQNYKLEKLPEDVNSIYDEISPVVSRDGKTLFFTRVGFPDFEKTLILENENFAETLSPSDYQQKLSGLFFQLGSDWGEDCSRSRFNQDVWLAKLGEDFELKNVEHPGFPLNNAFPNSLVCQTPDARTFYVVNQFPENGGLEKGFSVIQKEANGWGNPLPIEIDDFYTITSDVSLTMGFDGQVLILAAERFDSEKMDLYACFRAGENHWTSPKHLGQTINSVARETTPYLSEDNKTLFFSSNRNGKNGNDIFLSRRLDDTWQKWSVPEPLAPPVNSWADDSQPYFNMTTGYLYFTSKRSGGSDIYRLQIAPPQPTEIEISGRIINEKTGETISDVLIGYATISGQKNYSRDESGFYHLTIPKGVRFFLEFKKNGYATKTEEFFVSNVKSLFQENITRDILVMPLEVNSKIDLEPIFFVQSKAAILEKSFSALKKLAEFLKENPNISIRIEGHTDNIGKENELIRLSEDRANALKTFLVKEGVAESRIETLGFGAKFPLNDNSTEELKRLNRRVEIRIIKN